MISLALPGRTMTWQNAKISLFPNGLSTVLAVDEVVPGKSDRLLRCIPPREGGIRK